MTLPNTKLGQTGLTVSRLVLGTMTFGLQTDEETSIKILDTAAEAGINFLDTADVYPLGGGLPTAGRTEEIIGRWLKGKREHFIVATKAVGKVGTAPWDQGSSRKHILDAIDASLRRLGTDYVDLYQLHSDDASTPLDETLEALDTIVRAGKVRYIGVSNFLAYRLARALGRADVRHLTRFVSIQPRYNLLFREIERELLPLAQEEGLAVIPYNPLAGGLLTGKHNLAGGPTAGTRFTLGAAAERYQERYWRDREFNTVEELRTVADLAGLSLTTLALAWVLANPIITAPIIGASCPEQLADSLKAVEVKLDDNLKQKLNDITAEYRRGDSLR
ncbi:aldo/keto reductase [Anabaena cylindrica FACHB-243]|uniref:Aryl-alcohol dehydrogenase (NADP(+)) n=1 Tax=Anabaena cylindrica (strain ATCC 27899 / PCC 7122) TaxID=272123 RepID=K9ZC96_ANACC|nr:MULTISPECIES: aldo/keto reductase [Anabaena]AFZ56848.1 Aryl-alcohol dehydrogenase (NADP(+)) [Anabaena cylindrica PCC 7122]MBD2420152.1 aldo/keto reductase [Anabaena cylindrica FACHB-243]MBY5285587.1 aldo/keto reductase [Anabaena sp. CCAP 1446/1C]MBY5311363.1 aldo/keto reductase [Anabaena sp. CCAP 1446/1C]MCM2410161.1 aldo/keto reductase [Anabaena sp. CCAP 1446/1C]